MNIIRPEPHEDNKKQDGNFRIQTILKFLNKLLGIAHFICF